MLFLHNSLSFVVSSLFIISSQPKVFLHSSRLSLTESVGVSFFYFFVRLVFPISARVRSVENHQRHLVLCNITTDYSFRILGVYILLLNSTEILRKPDKREPSMWVFSFKFKPLLFQNLFG